MTESSRYNFFRQVGASLYLWPVETETQESFIQRVVLSAASRWMLTSLFIGDGATSVEKVRSSLKEKTTAFLELASLQDTMDIESIAGYIYDTLLSNGMFYHMQYYVRPAAAQLIGQGEIALLRGILPEERAFFSGLAPCVAAQGNDNLEDAFDLWDKNGKDTIELAWERSEKTIGEVQIEEWLNLHRREMEPYYLGKRRDQNSITLGRTRNSITPNNHEYYLIRGKEIRRISEEYKEIAMHDNIRVALMNNIHPQRVLYKKFNGKIDLEIGYLPARHDVRFMKLITWPENLAHINRPFRMSVHSDVFPLLESRFRRLGYQMEEIK